MIRKALVFLSIALILLSTGCVSTSGTDVTSLAKSLPEVKTFLNEYPNARIVVALWDRQTVSEKIQLIRGDCGPQMKETEYYRVTVSDPSLSLVVWIDKDTNQMICAVRQATGEAGDSEEGTIIEGDKTGVDYNIKWNKACKILRERGCRPESMADIAVNGTLLLSGEGSSLCHLLYGSSDPIECCEACCGNGVCRKMSYCGNGNCDSGEDSSTCPQDCVTKTANCGNGICESDEAIGICPSDCGTEIYPYSSDVQKCVDSTGNNWPASGYGYAPWFIWGGCSRMKYYNVNANEAMAFYVYTDSCPDCVCNHPNFYVYENIEGSWVKKNYYDLPDEQGISKIVEYVPSSSQIKIYANECFYMKVYSKNNVIPVTTTIKTCTDSDGGKNYYVKGTATASGQSLSDHCNSDGTLTEKYCSNNQIVWETYACPYGCSDGRCIDTTIINGTCGDGICQDSSYASSTSSVPESGENCPEDCAYMIYPYYADTTTCYDSSGKAYNAYGNSSPSWFVYGGCPNSKYYYVNPDQKVYFRAVTDACSSCVCYHPNFYVYEYLNGEWAEKKYFDLPDQKGISQVVYYTASSRQIKVYASQCFYLSVFAENPVTNTAPTTTSTVQNWFCNNTDWFGSGDSAHLQRLSTKGTCFDDYGVHEDTCLDSNRLNDYVCEPLMQEPKRCGHATYYCTSYGFAGGCVNGACVNATTTTSTTTTSTTLYPCHDSDNGLDYYTKGFASGNYNGNVNYSFRNYTDECIGSYQLNEGFCQSDGYMSIMGYICPIACIDGRCVTSATTTTTTSTTTVIFENQTLEFNNITDKKTVYANTMPYEFELKGYGSNGKTVYFYINNNPSSYYGWIEGSYYGESAFTIYVMNVTVTNVTNSTQVPYAKLFVFR